MYNKSMFSICDMCISTAQSVKLKKPFFIKKETNRYPKTNNVFQVIDEDKANSPWIFIKTISLMHCVQ